MAKHKQIKHSGERGNNIRFLSENVTVQALYLEPQDRLKPIKFTFRGGKGDAVLAAFTLTGPLVLPYAPVGWFVSDDGLVLSADGPVSGLIVYE